MMQARPIVFLNCMLPPQLSMPVILFAATVLLANGSCSAVDAAERRFHTIEVTVTDENGHPVHGAEVSPLVLVSKTMVHYPDESSWGVIPIGKSNKEGTATLRIPTSVRQQPIQAIQWSVRHEDYVATAFKSAAGQRAVECQLNRGRRIAVSAVNGRVHQRLRSDTFVVLSGQNAFDRWSRMSSGILVSDGVATNRQMLRIAYLPAGEPARYSAAVDLSRWDDQLRVFLHDVEVHEGTRVEGRLDDQVPRPIRGGIVSAFIVNGRNEWHDMAEVHEDGTFSISSLPRGEVLQLTASCPDWVSSDPVPAELEAVGMKAMKSRLQRSHVYPQVMRLDADVIYPTMRMEAAATCRVKVFETDGDPIRGARVRLIPYQGSFDGRSNVFGHGESTRRRLRAGVAGASTQRCVTLGIVRDTRTRFIALTGDDGIAEIKSLPGGPGNSPAMTSFVVTHPDYFAAKTGGLGDQGSSRAALYSGQTANVTVRMKKK
jgi:hypothetical protein